MTDNYLEHKFHDKIDKNCSTCWSEGLRTKKVDKPYYFSKLREELGISRNHFTDAQLSPNPFDR